MTSFGLMDRVRERAAAAGVPLAMHLDLTYRCNERCVHCYLTDRHSDAGEMSTGTITSLLDQLAQAGTLFLTISGGEPFLRRDLFEVLEHARRLRFDVRLKTNATMIGEAEAARVKSVGVREVQISVYSHRPDVHDAITKLPGSFARTVEGLRRLRSHGVAVTIAHVLMRENGPDVDGVRTLAGELGVLCTTDVTITPTIDGDPAILAHRLPAVQLLPIFRDRKFAGDPVHSPPDPAAHQEALDMVPCGAGHTGCYITPRGDVYPCVQFPLACGNVRRESFQNIWRQSARLAEVRSIRGRDLTTCSSCSQVSGCSRCPGLAFMEGSMRGPSSVDCEKSMLRLRASSTGVCV